MDEKTLGCADFAGNRQYVSVGNTTTDERVAMFFMDYPRRQHLKVLGHMRAYDASSPANLAPRLAVGDCKARVERFIPITVEAFDWNCPQHITPRFTLAELDKLVAPLNAGIAKLESRLETCEPVAME